MLPVIFLVKWVRTVLIIWWTVWKCNWSTHSDVSAFLPGGRAGTGRRHVCQNRTIAAGRACIFVGTI